jgi:hypothetical protein
MEMRFGSLILVIAAAIWSTQACNTGTMSKRQSARIATEAEAMLRDYHTQLAQHGLAAEFKFLDSTDQFSWHPAGYNGPINFDSVATTLRQLDDFYTSIQSKWDTLSIIPVSDTMATYTGEFTTKMTDVTGITDTYVMQETGTLIKRPDGWKMLTGKTTMINRIQ